MPSLGDKINDIIQDAVKDIIALADDREDELLEKIEELKG